MSGREEIIRELYRSIRDSISEFMWVERKKNTVVLYKRFDNRELKKVTISFRLKIEDSDIKMIDASEGLGGDK